MSESRFREVTEEEFKEIYFRLGGGPEAGRTPGYWQKFYAGKGEEGWRFKVEDPESPEYNRMWVITDTSAREYRVFFKTDQESDDLLAFPDYD